jgi:hypothetical protein
VLSKLHLVVTSIKIRSPGSWSVDIVILPPNMNSIKKVNYLGIQTSWLIKTKSKRNCICLQGRIFFYNSIFGCGWSDWYWVVQKFSTKNDRKWKMMNEGWYGMECISAPITFSDYFFERVPFNLNLLIPQYTQTIHPHISPIFPILFIWEKFTLSIRRN